MRLPIEWLHEYCRPEIATRELAEALTVAGLELERIDHNGVASPEGFVVGKVLRADQHPDADRLKVCSVDLGEGETAQIVCGAPNVAAGQTVAVAVPGAVMPDGTKLKRATLRGVESEGMILAEDELEIGADHAGTMVLDDALAAGTALGDVLAIATDVLELETFHNRPDTLGIYGLAREVHAVTGAALGPTPWSTDPGSIDSSPAGIEIAVECRDLCPRFTARVFEGVTVAKSPLWLKARLMAMGQRPINNVVDITNYAMLLTGHPLHAFDLDRVAGATLTVRRAAAGEEVETLDGVTRSLDADMVVIADADGPTSIAGVMGGSRSEVGDDTGRVLMEVATWDGAMVHRASTRLGLRSEASSRFEKQLGRASVLHAQAVATKLMIDLCGATIAPGTLDIGGPGEPAPVVLLRPDAIEALLGVSIPVERCVETLARLGFGVEDGDGGELVVTVPDHRGDIAIEADLIEEIARIDGLEKLAATLPAGAPARLSTAQRRTRRVLDVLSGAGIYEIAGWSFASPGFGDRLRLEADDPRRNALALANPMSEDQSVMRSMLLPSLLDAARHNATHANPHVRLCEEGAVYRAGEPLPAEARHVAVLLNGPSRPPTWRETASSPSDFFAAKGVLAAVMDDLSLDWTLTPLAEAFLHPGRGASVLVADTACGWIGELHPLVCASWDLDAGVAFELELAALIAAPVAPAIYTDVTSFPAIHQDLAVVVADSVPAARVLDVIRASAGALLGSSHVFDVYAGEQVGDGQVSLAVALEFRAPDRTLSDDDVAAPRAAIAQALTDELGASLRG